jgi:hypothetical protein
MRASGGNAAFPPLARILANRMAPAVRHEACENAAHFCPSETPRVEINDWRDAHMRCELPFNSFWIADFQENERAARRAQP